LISASSRSCSVKRHNAGKQRGELPEKTIFYPFHPRCGESVPIVERLYCRDLEIFVVRQRDGTGTRLPAWTPSGVRNSSRNQNGSFRARSTKKLTLRPCWTLRSLPTPYRISGRINVDRGRCLIAHPLLLVVGNSLLTRSIAVLRDVASDGAVAARDHKRFLLGRPIAIRETGKHRLQPLP
jgi:hypothetical protein